MSTTRATNARHVRQRKLNTKQPLQILREAEIHEQPEDEVQRQIPQVETGVEKAEEIVRPAFVAHLIPFHHVLTHVPGISSSEDH